MGIVAGLARLSLVHLIAVNASHEFGIVCVLTGAVRIELEIIRNNYRACTLPHDLLFKNFAIFGFTHFEKSISFFLYLFDLIIGFQI